MSWAGSGLSGGGGGGLGFEHFRFASKLPQQNWMQGVLDTDDQVSLTPSLVSPDLYFDSVNGTLYEVHKEGSIILQKVIPVGEAGHDLQFIANITNNGERPKMAAETGVEWFVTFVRNGKISVNRECNPGFDCTPTQPTAPSNMVLVNAGQVGQFPQFSWTGTQDPDLDGYEVWRGFQFGKPFEIDWGRIATVGAGTTSYTDLDVQITDDPNGLIFHYKVLAFDLQQNKSDFSNKVNTRAFLAPKQGTDEDTKTTVSSGNTFRLHPNYPNPFNPTTQISYQLPEPGQVRLEIYNLVGQTIRTLVREVQPAGDYTKAWDGRNELGREAASGVYLVRLQMVPVRGNARPFRQVTKITLMR